MPESQNLVIARIRAGHLEKTNLGVPSLRYKLSHHCIVVILPNLNQCDRTQQSFSARITHHMCATSWLWVPAMRFLAARSAFSRSTRNAVVRPVIKPCPYCLSIVSYYKNRRMFTQFSIAPASKSLATRVSSFGNGYSISNACS